MRQPAAKAVGCGGADADRAPAGLSRSVLFRTVGRHGRRLDSQATEMASGEARDPVEPSCYLAAIARRSPDYKPGACPRRACHQRVDMGLAYSIMSGLPGADDRMESPILIQSGVPHGETACWRRTIIRGAFAMLIVALLGAPSLIYPFGRDQGEYATVATELLSGRMPYRDVFSVKPPLTDLVHVGALAIFGHSTLSDSVAGPDLAVRHNRCGLPCR